MPTPIYHITHVDNLPGIVQAGGLWCDAVRRRQGFPCVGIAHENLKARRSRKSVQDGSGRPIAAGGVLADYVPFYFANRSPMLCAVHYKKIVGYAGGQHDIVHLVSAVETVAARTSGNTTE